jgi:hypothetical protein
MNDAPVGAVGGLSQAAGLLAAGAVLPPDAVGAGERAVALTARSYRHPGLEDRVVVRLVPAELGVAEDAAAGFLGLEPAAEPAVVGLGLRQTLGFPEWVLVHYPADGHHALALMPELERAARQAKTRAKVALDAYQELAGRLAAAVPHFLPTFYEQAGRVFLSVENPAYAAQMFGRARAADAEHGLPIDEERVDSVFLEFALAGALPVKVLADYGKDVASRVPAQEALARFTRLCIRRTAGGLPPSVQMTAELRKIAKAAGADVGAAESDLLAELLRLPATLRAAVGWWKAHSTAVVALAKREPGIRRALLDAVPADSEAATLWLDILIDSGAVGALYTPEAPEELRPSDGTVGWLSRFQGMRESVGWRHVAGRMPRLYQLVEQCANRLREEMSGAAAPPLDVPEDVDLLDLLLSIGVPVDDPGENGFLNLETWSAGEGQRDLLALAADPRFRDAFHAGADRFNNNDGGLRSIRALTASAGGRAMLADWVREVARKCSVAGLPNVPAAIRRLSWLPGEALALAETEARAAAAIDLAPVLARTLRAGLFDELTWPAWEQAAAQLVAADRVGDLVIYDAWPHLIVAGPSQARVIGAEGTALTHDLRIPGNRRYRHDDPGLHYVDGELLVYWRDGSEVRGYWHNSANRVQSVEIQDGGYTRGVRMDWYRGMTLSLPLPGGGRATVGGIIHRGDTAVPKDGVVIGDGTSYWVWENEQDDAKGWHEYDPASRQRGRRSDPAFFADTLRAAPPGSSHHSYSGILLPGANGELSGYCVVTLPDRSRRLRTISGLEVTVPKGAHEPVHALVMPGDDRPRALVRGDYGSDEVTYYEIAIVDADGVVTATAKTDRAPGAFARGTLILPPTRYWHLLQPRDPEGSAALRQVDDSRAALLLKAATEQRLAAEDDLTGIVRELLPEVTDSALIAGVCGVVGFAANQQAELDRAAARLDRALSGGTRDTGPSGPQDELFYEPLRGFGGDTRYWYNRTDGIFHQIRLIGDAVRELPADEAPAAMRLHLGGPELPAASVTWWSSMPGACAALALRSATASTAPQTAEALHELLRVYDAAGLAAPVDATLWRLMRLHLPERLLKAPDGSRRSGSWHGLLPVGTDRLIAFVDSESVDNGVEFTALYHDPSGRFDVPEPYALRSSSLVGEDRAPGWLAAFLKACADRGTAPWFPEAAEKFARLTGVTATEARLIVAGLPGVGTDEGNALSPDARKLINAKAGEISVARGRLWQIATDTRRAVVAALLPTEPVRLWTEGPDVAAAAEVWNRLVGPRAVVPEALMVEVARGVTGGSDPAVVLPALLDPDRAPQLSRDLAWKVDGDRVVQADRNAEGFTALTLTGSISVAAWLAHRLPAGDPLRAPLPAALAALRARLSDPGLMLSLDHYANLAEFRKAAGAPTEVGAGYERYGAVIMATGDGQPIPAISVAHLDEAGADPFLPTLRPEAHTPFPAELALGLARDPVFAAHLADPGDPVAGERAKDGTWYPQDPARSVPDLVAEVARDRSLGADAAAVYLMLLAMPDPTDRAIARWTGWKPARMAAAHAELAATDMVVQASRRRAGRSLFLPGVWIEPVTSHLPLEAWKASMYGGLLAGDHPVLGVIAPIEPAGRLYRRAWRRVLDGDGPRFAELETRRGRPRRQ